jgi:hypothetical protein
MRGARQGNSAEGKGKAGTTSDAFCRTLRPERQNCSSEYFTDLEGVTYKRRQGKEPVLVARDAQGRETICP